jgi:hypothetical protein
MERLIRGTEVSGEVEASGAGGFCEFSMLVRKGHEECGDSAFAYVDGEKAVFAVFDGVSGEAGASSASSAAAEALMASLGAHDRITPAKMKSAVLSAHGRITGGMTTAVIVFIRKDGSFMVAGVGDSPAYSIDSNGAASIELPLARTVGDGSSILKFFYFRNLLTSALGGGQAGMSLHIREGKMKKGEVLILSSDGLTDNLYVTVKDGYVTESSGVADLSGILGKERRPAEIVRLLSGAIASRLPLGRVERPESMLVPKEDDLAIIAVRMKRPMD